MGVKNYVPCYSVIGRFRWDLVDVTKSNLHFEAIHCSFQTKRIPVMFEEANKQAEDCHILQCDPAQSGRKASYECWCLSTRLHCVTFHKTANFTTVVRTSQPAIEQNLTYCAE